MCYSQTQIYKHYGVDEGLPSAEVYDIYQDKDGYIWFATDKGLSRFNGYEFKNYTIKDGLPDNTILDFFPQENGQVWCYGFNSQNLFYFDEEFDGFKSYKYNNALKKQTDENTILKSVFVYNNDVLYAGGYGFCGLIEIDKNGVTKKHYDLDTRLLQPIDQRPVHLGVQNKKNIFFSVCYDLKSNEDVQFLNLEYKPSSRLDFISFNDNYSIFINGKLGEMLQNGDIKYYETKQNPLGIKKINNHSYFVGYYGNGAEIRDIKGNIIKKFLPKKSVSNFLIDNEGSYWFTTIDDGVFYIKNPKIKIFTEEHITSLVKDHNNILYAGFNNGSIGHISKNKINILYKGLNNDDALVEFDVKREELYGYSDSKITNYTYPKKSFKIDASKLPEHIGDSLISASSNFIYKTIKRFTTKYKVQDICAYNNVTLLGTSSGLFYQKNEKIIKHQPFKFLNSRIDDIDLNKKTNTVYMASQGEGVIVYNDHPYNITKANGLTNDIISEIHIENDSTVWTCSNTGLNRIRFKPNKTYSIATITKADGLLSNDINDIEIINDTVWVATKKGLCYFNKEVLADKEASKVLSLNLKKVTANNRPVDFQNLKLKHNENTIDFSLQAISHKNTGNLNYLYRLKEIDTNWTTTKNRKISFPSLSPGNYTFQAKASVFNNISAKFLEYKFKILLPFWKSWWFYILCLLSFIGLIYAFFKYRLLTYNKEIIRELIRLTIKRLKRKELFYNFKSNGEEFKIPTKDIHYIKSDGNYLDIVTHNKTHTIRCKIGDFIATTPDALEYLRIHRSYIIRIDQVTSKGKNWVVINEEKIPVGRSYLKELINVQF